jgi:hypothetical protein
MSLWINQDKSGHWITRIFIAPGNIPIRDARSLHDLEFYSRAIRQIFYLLCDMA